MPPHPSAIDMPKAKLNTNDYQLNPHTLRTQFKGWMSQHHHHSLILPQQRWLSKYHHYLLLSHQWIPTPFTTTTITAAHSLPTYSPQRVSQDTLITRITQHLPNPHTTILLTTHALCPHYEPPPPAQFNHRIFTVHKPIMVTPDSGATDILMKKSDAHCLSNYHPYDNEPPPIFNVANNHIIRPIGTGALAIPRTTLRLTVYVFNDNELATPQAVLRQN
jgi:hypothetical protein